MKIIFVMILLAAELSIAAPKACDLCEKVAKVEGEMASSPKSGLEKAIMLIASAKFSKEPKTLQEEVKSILRLSVQVFPKDDSNQAAEYFVSLYQAAPKEFDKQIEQLPKSNRKMIKDSLKHNQKLLGSGNG